MARLIQLDHSEVVAAVQRVMFAQLYRDGRYQRDMELGLTFYAESVGAMRVEGTVRHQGQVLYALAGSSSDLCAIATDLALSKLAPEESRGYRPAASVRFRVVKFTGDEGSIDRIMVDVEFQGRQAISA